MQDIDQMCLFKPLCKFTATITRVEEIIPTLQKALQVAQSGTPGMLIQQEYDFRYNMSSQIYLQNICENIFKNVDKRHVPLTMLFKYIGKLMTTQQKCFNSLIVSFLLFGFIFIHLCS